MSISKPILTLLALGLAFAQHTTFAADAGTIQQISGSVSILAPDKAPRRASARDVIQSGETLVTEGRSEAVVKMPDETAVLLRPNTQFQFSDVKYDKKATDSVFLTLLRGTARMVSGLVGKANPAQMRIVASTATIGIRGTDFEVSVVGDDSPDARAGVYNLVHDGGTNIRIASGQSLDVNREQTAFAPARLNPGEEPLQILRDRPVFLQQGGGLDALIQSITITPPPPPMIFR
jgi:hypothetical protein